ncbi:hypothetical protein GQ457_08G000270 [Hibiscus cannabinus]
MLGSGEGCLEEERVALSRLKPFFPFIDSTFDVGGPGSHYFYHDVWEDYVSPEEKESSIHCCKWRRVECNPTTGRVTKLLLDGTQRVREYDSDGWHLNVSLFLPFKELQSLYLSGNNIVGCVTHQGFDKLSSKLDKLENLDLSNNRFNDSILAPISKLSSLKFLDLTSNFPLTRSNRTNGIKMLSKLNNLEILNLSNIPLGNNIMSQLHDFTSLKSLSLQNCELGGAVDLMEFNTLMNLSELQLGYNNIESLDSSFQDKGQLKLNKLEVLGLSGNNFTNSIFSSLAVLPNLKSLSLAFYKSKGPVDMKELLRLKKLETLRIDYTVLENNFLQKIGTMPSLRILKLFECVLNGTLHDQGFCGLTNLQELDMSNNNLKGNLPECISNFTSLKSLSLCSNQFSGDIFALETLTSLESLDLSSNQFFGDVSALKALTSLKSLDLSSNKFLGNVSTLKALTSLQVLSLSNNYFRIPSSLGPFFNLSQLQRFQADNNTIYVESEMQSSVPRFQLNEIRLSCCGDAGQVPQFLYYQRDLRHVDLSNINLKGGFPNWLLQNNTNLRSLNLANNSLQGHFELPFPTLTDLSRLDISKNSINGNVPIEIGVKLPSLSYLNMSRNHFHGDIPASIGDMNSLEYLDLSHNQLSGGLPEHLATGCSSLFSLTLSNNSLQGQMFSSKFNLTNLLELRLDGNHFSGKIPDSLSSCSWLSTLDVSNNKLVGEIPRWIGNMSSLREIMMAQNHLEGPFPEEFCHLHLLKLLDLSVNNISGHIPTCFSPILISQVHLSRNKLQGPLTNAFRYSNALVTLDLSNNHLTGKIPNWIGNLSQMSYLLLNNNHFEGMIPLQLCNLGHLSLIDLSNNNLSGTIPSCLKITTWNEGSQEYVRYIRNVNTSFSFDEPIEFTSKNNSYSYKGRVLTYLSGIDFSCNKLTGEIPSEVNNFRDIYALNLSHNSLIGSIPQAFSNLKQIESLDLSHNKLSGIIPPELVGLYMLSYFSVAYNNLSGSTPVMTAQFSTFEESSYIGNPFLCGKPLPKNCSTSGPSSLPKGSTDKGLIDMTAFYASFGASYVVGKSANVVTIFWKIIFCQKDSIVQINMVIQKNMQISREEALVFYFLFVAYNNLSGSTPVMTAQFSTFEESGYVGNPLLCGKSLPKNCSTSGPSSLPKESTDKSLIDMTAFYASFGASYIVGKSANVVTIFWKIIFCQKDSIVQINMVVQKKHNLG